MICVPYIVNDNYKVAQLSATQSPKPCYIIQKEPGNSEVKLFSFDPKQFAFDPSEGCGTEEENDFSFVAISSKSSVTIDVASHTANIKVALQMKRPKCGDNDENIKDNDENINKLEPSFEAKDGLSIKGSDVYYNFSTIEKEVSDILVINIQLLVADEPKFYYDFSVNVAPREKTWDIVIDFGSEATQILINKRYNEPSLQAMMDLFETIKLSSSTVSNAADAEIYQFDPSNPKLFRSLFFLKNKIKINGTNTQQQSDITFINLEDEITNLLKENVALPNMKLMDHNNVPLPKVYINHQPLNIYHRVREIRAEILKFFFKTALRQIDDISDDMPSVACKITFLVPNTYTQGTLSSVHSQLILDLQKLKEQEKFKNIKGDIEVSTFSESDASFFGWYSKSQYKKSDAQKRVLIVDIGKGTTDFSVLRISSNQGDVTIERMARSGFVGAGNVMTFALLASVIRQIANKKGVTNTADIYTAIRDMAYDSDRAKKNKLYRELETLKCAPHITGGTTIAEFIDKYDVTTLASLSELSINKLTDIIAMANEEECFLQDNDPVVSCYAKQITDRLISELRYVYGEKNDVDEVVLSGRGAMSNPLANAIKETFGNITQLSHLDAKSGCLIGPLNRSLHLDHMNMNIVGWPQQILNQKPDDTQKKEKKKKQDLIGGLLSRFFSSEKDVVAIIKSDGTIVNTGYSQEIANSLNSSVTPSQQKEKWLEAQGKEYNIEEDTNLFVIGNRRYSAHLLGAHSKLGKKKMYFDGNDFLLRDDNTSIRFIPDPNNDDEGFLTETFFPMTELNGSVKVNMPQLDKVLCSCGGVEDEDEFDDEDTQPKTATTTTTTVSTTTTATTVPLTATTTNPSDDEDDFAADDDD